MKKDLNRNTRGINHFLHLKSDFENDSERLFNSLPLFHRIMYLDQPNPWVEQINRFDFLRLATLSSDFDIYQKINIGNFKYKRITPLNKIDIIELELADFLSRPILSSGNFEYTAQEFILSLAYTGGIHMKPDKNKEKINFLYENLFLNYPDFCFELTKAISKIFIDIYDELYSLAVGDNNGHSLNINYQAKIVDNGKLLDGALFEKAYMQFPIRAKNKMGIRIYIEIKTSTISNRNVILAYGHRKNKKLNLLIWQQKTKIIASISTDKVNRTIVVDIETLLDHFFTFEIAVYPNGKVSTSINELLKSVDDLEHDVEIIDGKVILGSNLDGTEFGTFYEKTLITQSIDKADMTRNLGIYALFQRMNVPSRILPYNLVKRKI